jgi:uncharacterized protein
VHAIKVGSVAALFRYPVKSMRGERLDATELGWHGIAGDRRLALRRTGDQGGFPWLTATRVPELLLFRPRSGDAANGSRLPTHALTPEGKELPIFSAELAEDIGRRHGAPVEMMHVRQGVFDDGSISIITTATVDHLSALARLQPDVRRFRPNILIASSRAIPFAEDEWVGSSLTFGAPIGAPAVTVTSHDERCAMVNLDPDTAAASPALLKAIVRTRDNRVGLYATVIRTGSLEVGQDVYLVASMPPARSAGIGT